MSKTSNKKFQLFLPLLLEEICLFDDQGKMITGITAIQPYLSGIIVMTKDKIYSNVELNLEKPIILSSNPYV